MQKMKLDANNDPIMGIDLGTTNSAVAIYNAGTVPTLLPIGGPNKFTVQSCVKWEAPEMLGCKAWTVGEAAYEERYMPDVCYSVKRIMGSDQKIKFIDRYNPDHALELTPSEVSSIILQHIKERVADLYCPITKCVITVPAYFNQRQIEDTTAAAKMAGLNCLQILKEPTSASYIYSQLGYAQNGSVLIYDLGGGTFDVTHMTFLRRDNIPKKLLTSLKQQYGIELSSSTADVNDQYFCRVLGTYGDMRLGGDDIDKALGDALIERDSLELSPQGTERLYLECESFKKSGVYGMDLNIEGHRIHVTSADLDKAVDKIFDRTMYLISDVDFSDVKTIVLVGGSTKSQRIRDNLAAAFPGVEISAVLDPDATVALGAGSVAKAIANNAELMYADVLPLPIGVLVDEDHVEVCIPRNTSMPHTFSKDYHTLHDNQEAISIDVYQGLSTSPKECTYLGRLRLANIPRAPAGEVVVNVSFMLNGQGLLKVISTIAGVDREEELVIDNIFAVSNDAGSTDIGSEAYLDEFEACFMPLLEGKDEAVTLFAARRMMISAGESTVEIEDQIASLIV